MIKEHYLKKLSAILDISLESLLKRSRKTYAKKIWKIKLQLPQKDKEQTGNLEEYLLALIVQSENPKAVLEENKGNFQDYKFETLSLRKNYWIL